MRRVMLLLVVGSVLWLAACSGGNAAFTITSITTVCLPSPIQSSQQVGCFATVAGTGAFSTMVNWTTTAGSVNTAGVFTAPVVLRLQR